MIPDGPLTDRDGPQKPDDTRPVFLNTDFNAPDDMGDWWLDLGRVDLPA